MFIYNSDSNVRALLNQTISDVLLTPMGNKICIPNSVTAIRQRRWDLSFQM